MKCCPPQTPESEITNYNAHCDYLLKFLAIPLEFHSIEIPLDFVLLIIRLRVFDSKVLIRKFSKVCHQKATEISGSHSLPRELSFELFLIWLNKLPFN